MVVPSLLKATNPHPTPRLSSNISSPLCPPFAGAQAKWLQMKLCDLALQEALCAPALSPWQREILLLFTAEGYLGSFLALVL